MREAEFKQVVAFLKSLQDNICLQKKPSLLRHLPPQQTRTKRVTIQEKTFRNEQRSSQHQIRLIFLQHRHQNQLTSANITQQMLHQELERLNRLKYCGVTSIHVLLYVFQQEEYHCGYGQDATQIVFQQKLGGV